MNRELRNSRKSGLIYIQKIHYLSSEILFSPKNLNTDFFFVLIHGIKVLYHKKVTGLNTNAFGVAAFDLHYVKRLTTVIFDSTVYTTEGTFLCPKASGYTIGDQHSRVEPSSSSAVSNLC